MTFPRFSARAQRVLREPLDFAMKVLSRFNANGGFLLASAVAYNALLSIIPILALAILGLSQWFDPQTVDETLRRILELMAPTQVDLVLEQLARFRGKSKVVGLVGFASLIFFSALAFSALGRALEIIFKPDVSTRRKPWVSILLPYAFVLFISLAILAITLLAGAMELLAPTRFGHWLPDTSFIIAVSGFLGETTLFAMVYLVLVPVKVRLRHALVGAVSAAILWELMRNVLVWFFVNVSTVNLIYGAFAAVLVIVLSLEVAMTILLLGAQVIREYTLLESD